MQTIPLAQLQELFAELRQQNQGAIDTEQPWSYYFSAPTTEALDALSNALDSYHFDGDEIDEDEDRFFLELTRVETHTPESLFALNAELEAAAARFEGVVYEGMNIQTGDEDGCCCGGDGCGECGDEDSEEEHECCGGHGHEEGGCCGGHGHGKEGGCCGKHYHSADDPIENPELLTAIGALSNDRSEAAQRALTLALQRGLYLVPALAGRPGEEPADDDAVQILVCTDENNDEYLPLFTDEAALKAWTQEAVSAMVMTAPEAWDFILAQPECAGGVINPASAGLPLNREMVGMLKKMLGGE
ncbi:MAG: SseB family protein [Chthoniobacteraceae bacterium]|nr:SseB family protein [Chthoniobacteraceae bacterium]